MKDINLFKVKDSFYLREVSSKEEVLEILNYPKNGKSNEPDGFLIRSDEKLARRIIASLKDKKIKKIIAFVGGDDVMNRRVIESLKIDYLISPERDAKFDNLKQRDSGLNHVVAKIAKEKDVTIVVDMGEIASLDGKERALRIAKAMQNIKVCRKAGCSLKIASCVNKKRGILNEKVRKSFGVGLGMSSEEIRDCVLFGSSNKSK